MTNTTAVLIETAMAVNNLAWILEDDGDFESPEDYRQHWSRWIDLSRSDLEEELLQNLIDNQVFAEEFAAFAAANNFTEHAAKEESLFLARIEFDEVYRWLHQTWLTRQQAGVTSK